MVRSVIRGMIFRLAVVAATVPLAACSSGGEAIRAASTPLPSTATVTESVTTIATATATVTEVQSATVTATVTAPAPVSGPVDITDAYVDHARRAGMPNRQASLIVRAQLYGGELTVLTTMRRPWGGWDCAWEPAVLDGAPVQFVRILHEDETVFRLCK